jgi:hypothetical protein
MYVQSGERAKYDDDTQELIVGTYFATCDAIGVDPLLVVSQLIVETDNLTGSSAQRSRLDPVGIAAARSPDAWTGFRSWLQASRVHAGLVLAFALPKGAENDVQARLLDEALRWRTVPDNDRGSAPTLDRFARLWTAPQPPKDYAERIRRIANTILEPQY